MISSVAPDRIILGKRWNQHACDYFEPSPKFNYRQSLSTGGICPSTLRKRHSRVARNQLNERLSSDCPGGTWSRTNDHRQEERGGQRFRNSLKSNVRSPIQNATLAMKQDETHQRTERNEHPPPSLHYLSTIDSRRCDGMSSLPCEIDVCLLWCGPEASDASLSGMWHLNRKPLAAEFGSKRHHKDRCRCGDFGKSYT